MDFDLDTFATTDDAVWFDLTSPDDDDVVLTRNGSPVRIALYGLDSPTMTAFDLAASDKLLSKAGKTGKVAMTAAELDAQTKAKLAAAVAGWENFAAGGKDLPFSEAAARDLVGKHRWLRRFIERKLADEGNFRGTGASAPTT